MEPVITVQAAEASCDQDTTDGSAMRMGFEAKLKLSLLYVSPQAHVVCSLVSINMPTEI